MEIPEQNGNGNGNGSEIFDWECVGTAMIPWEWEEWEQQESFPHIFPREDPFPLMNARVCATNMELGH